MSKGTFFNSAWQEQLVHTWAALVDRVRDGGRAAVDGRVSGVLDVGAVLSHSPGCATQCENATDAKSVEIQKDVLLCCCSCVVMCCCCCCWSTIILKYVPFDYLHTLLTNFRMYKSVEVFISFRPWKMYRRRGQRFYNNRTQEKNVSRVRGPNILKCAWHYCVIPLNKLKNVSKLYVKLITLQRSVLKLVHLCWYTHLMWNMFRSDLSLRKTLVQQSKLETKISDTFCVPPICQWFLTFFAPWALKCTTGRPLNTCKEV